MQNFQDRIEEKAPVGMRVTQSPEDGQAPCLTERGPGIGDRIVTPTLRRLRLRQGKC